MPFERFVKGQGLSEIVLSDDWNDPLDLQDSGYYNDPEPRKPKKRDPKVRRDRHDRGKERIV